MPCVRHFSVVASKPPEEIISSCGPEPITSKRVSIPSMKAVGISKSQIPNPKSQIPNPTLRCWVRRAFVKFVPLGVADDRRDNIHEFNCFLNYLVVLFVQVGRQSQNPQSEPRGRWTHRQLPR